MAEIKVHFSKTIGTVKPMHGVGQPPFSGVDFSMFHYLKEAGMPFSRLHDVGGVYGQMRFVDIPNIFRDFDADPEDPNSYDFTFTDLLVTALVENDVEPFFRLGVTIENDVAIKYYRLDPPKDNLKWAKICEGVIRHYTEGWANGFHYKIRYWEIWNEPDNAPDLIQNQMWQGSDVDYFELYAVASRYLKEKFPHLKIGGYASSGFYHLKMSYIPDAKSSPRKEYFLTFFDDFLKYIKERNCPLDFYSWHSYDSIENNMVYARYAREKLDEAGFTDTETSCNEWNSEVKLRGTPKHAAITAGMMLAFEDAPLDNAMFYDARLGVSVYGSLFNPLTREPLKSYYSFVAFNELYKKKNRVCVEGLPKGIYGDAATDGEKSTLVLANPGDEDVEISLNTDQKLVSCRILDENHDLTEGEFAGVIGKDTVLVLDFE